MQEFITYKNIKVAFSSEGKGNAVVLLHGFLENIKMWNAVKQELLPKNRVVTINLLGHGATECLGYVHTMEENAELVNEVLKYLKLRRITLIGHSMGGYVCLAFAEKFPEKVKKLCLMNSTSQPDSEERKKLRLRAVEMAKINYQGLVSMSISNLFAENVRVKYSTEIEKCKNDALKVSVQSYIACSEGMRLRLNREKILLKNSYDKLMIIGKNDPIISAELVKQEAQRTNTRYVEFSNGHMSHIENKEELINVLKDFLHLKTQKRN